MNTQSSLTCAPSFILSVFRSFICQLFFINAQYIQTNYWTFHPLTLFHSSHTPVLLQSSCKFLSFVELWLTNKVIWRCSTIISLNCVSNAPNASQKFLLSAFTVTRHVAPICDNSSLLGDSRPENFEPGVPASSHLRVFEHLNTQPLYSYIVFPMRTKYDDDTHRLSRGPREPPLWPKTDS